MNHALHLAPELEAAVIDPRVRVGHVHLKVANLDRSLAFYCNVLGFRVTGRVGNGMAFIAAGDYHHHLALSSFESPDGPPPAAGTTGLHHFALLYPSRPVLADAVRRVMANSVIIDKAFDHGGSESVFIHDPDQTCIELTWDRPMEEWPRDNDGQLLPVQLPLDVAKLASEGPLE